MVFLRWNWNLILFSCIHFSLWSNLSACFCKNIRIEAINVEWAECLHPRQRLKNCWGRLANWSLFSFPGTCCHASSGSVARWMPVKGGFSDHVQECLLSSISGVISTNVLMTVLLFMKVLPPYSGVTRNVMQHAHKLSSCSLCFLNKNDAPNGYDTIVS